MKVPFLDLAISDMYFRKKLLDRINKVLRSGKILDGNEQKDFEKKFGREVGAKYVVGVSSGSSALFLALKANGIGYGDEVITTPFTWIITINAITSVGATPKFVDIDENFNIDPKKIESAITKKTKAIIPVHIGGKLCEMDIIFKLANYLSFFFFLPLNAFSKIPLRVAPDLVAPLPKSFPRNSSTVVSIYFSIINK